MHFIRTRKKSLLFQTYNLCFDRLQSYLIRRINCVLIVKQFVIYGDTNYLTLF